MPASPSSVFTLTATAFIVCVALPGLAGTRAAPTQASVPAVGATRSAPPATYVCPDDAREIRERLTPPLHSYKDRFQPFNLEVQNFLIHKCYTAYRDWARDASVRDTGPFAAGVYYGVHPAVRIYYSPEVHDWLKEGRAGDLPDGAIIVKEQYPGPAAPWNETALPACPEYGWSVMIKRKAASKDGWFWGGYTPPPAGHCGARAPDARTDPAAAGAPPAPDSYPFVSYPYGGFGQINGCMRCHVSAASESTFSSLANIDGTASPLQYLVAPDPKTTAPDSSSSPAPAAHMGEVEPRSDFVTLFPPVTDRRPDPARLALPPVIFDTVVAGPGEPAPFVTANQCQTCHGGLSTPPYGPVMYISHEADPLDDLRAFAHQPGGHDASAPGVDLDGINLSPFGEWRWSMMGLAGRDPIFYAQLESEEILHPQAAAPVQNLCLSCHGSMGERQHRIDAPVGAGVCAQPGDPGCFTLDEALGITKDGALARDGISCTVCHQMEPYERLQDVDYGRFTVSHGTIRGPYEEPAAYAMETSLGFEVEENDFIKSSELCASCHTIRIPILDDQGRYAATMADGQPVQQAFFEQATYLEWKNSAYSASGPEGRTCQNCHMPDRYPYRAAESLESKIAVIQDQSYPYFEHMAPTEDITVRPRDEFARHTLHGLNLFALEMFDQMDRILGVPKTDYMTGSETDLQFAMDDTVDFATRETADVSILQAGFTTGAQGARALEVRVQVVNRTGHRFPTGVGFRRAFLQVEVTDSTGAVHWVSGNTNALGVIVDGNGVPLPSELFEGDPQAYEPHYDVITRQDQVQIYEELVRDPQGAFTTSFTSLCDTVKDNRLLPRGWTAAGPADFPTYPSQLATPVRNASPHACEARTSLDTTYPSGKAATDPRYGDGSGTDEVTYRIDAGALPVDESAVRVRATLYYQAIPPSYLKERFDLGRQAPDPVQIERLYYLTSRLKVDETPIDDWKLRIASDETAVGER